MRNCENATYEEHARERREREKGNAREEEMQNEENGSEIASKNQGRERAKEGAR